MNKDPETLQLINEDYDTFVSLVSCMSHECHDGFCIFFCAYDIYLVACEEQGVTIGDDYVSVVQAARAYEVASQVFAEFQDGLPVERGVDEFDAHQVWFHCFLIAILVIIVLFFFLHVDFVDHTDEDDRQDEAHHSERIGACIAVCDSRYGASEVVGSYLF